MLTWREEIIWAAGFFDGDGCSFTVNSKSGGYPRIQVGQNDTYVLDRFRAAMGGLGQVNPNPSKTSGGSDHWYYRCTKWADVQAIIAMMWLSLSPAKKAQATEVLMKFRTKARRGCRSVTP